MGSRPGRFTEADLRKVIKVAKREDASLVEIRPDGTVLVHLASISDEEREIEAARMRDLVP